MNGLSFKNVDDKLQLSGHLTQEKIIKLLKKTKHWQKFSYVDMKEVSAVDSAGLAFLIREVIKLCKLKSKWLNCSPKVRAMCQIYNLNQFIDFQ